MKIQIAVLVLIVTTLIAAQDNTWSIVTGREVGHRNWAALNYCPDSNRFILSIGNEAEVGGNPYEEMVYTTGLGKWINFLPHDSLYGSTAVTDSIDALNGNWGDSTGPVYGHGKAAGGDAGWFTTDGYMRPRIWWQGFYNAYNQYAYNSDNAKIYYYLENRTFSYDTKTRRWDTLGGINPCPPVNNNYGAWKLNYGSLCYDPINKELVLFGGTNVDMPNGTPGTWTYKVASNTWTKLNGTVEPPARANSPMVYDAKNHCIVLFGGERFNSTLADTWIYDCATKTWSQKKPAVGPSPRAGHALLYLPKSQTIVLLGGYISFNGAVKVPFEIWKYDAAANSWQLVKAIQSGSVFPDFNGWRYRCPMVAADTSDNIIALADTSGFYSQYRPMTYKLHFSATEVDAAGTSTYGITDGAAWHPSGNLDPAWYTQGVPAVDTAANELSLRNIPVRTWTAVVPPKMPAGGRDYGTTVIDPDHDLILKFAGGHSAVPYNDVPQYSISENRYSLGYAPVTMLEHNGIFGINGYTFDNRPFLAIHTWHAYSYSEKLKRMVFVKGDLTYTYDPVKKDWDSLHIPAPAAGYTIGTPHGVFAIGSYGIYLLDSLRGTWRQAVATNWAYNSGCDLRDYGGICYDSKRDRVLVFASCAANAAPKILEYSYTTNTVSNLYPGDSNLVKNSTAYSYLYEASAYLPGSDKILFMGTAGQNGSTYVHYLLNCATNKWETQTVTAPSAMWERGLSGMAFMYDAKRNLVWCSDAQCKLYTLRMDAFTTASKQNADELAGSTKLIITPNPFNPVTTLNIELPFSGDIKLAVYGADGAFIREIASGYFKRGKYSFGWQGNNQRNGRAATGVYFCKLTAGKSTITVKTVITK